MGWLGLNELVYLKCLNNAWHFTSVDYYYYYYYHYHYSENDKIPLAYCGEGLQLMWG